MTEAALVLPSLRWLLGNSTSWAARAALGVDTPVLSCLWPDASGVRPTQAQPPRGRPRQPWAVPVDLRSDPSTAVACAAIHLRWESSQASAHTREAVIPIGGLWAATHD